MKAKTKHCSKCKLDKSTTEFNLRSGKLQPYCKDCNKQYQREHYLRNKEKYIKESVERKRAYRQEMYELLKEFANDGCEQCGETDFACLDFDHIDQTTKLFAISAGIGSQYSVERIKAELLKCRVLCANCHRKHTAKQCGWYNLGEQND
jgi:hypothetical protein